MDRKRIKEEYLEILWHMKEDDNPSLAFFKEEAAESYRPELLGELEAEGIVEISGASVRLTERGCEATRQLIRAHRLAERLVHDVLGVEYERGACEFEHIINQDLVDSICTLLGHPRQCPHGMPIPEGECCRQQAKAVESSVIPIAQLQVGESARIAYVYGDTDQQLHKLDNLLIRPAALVKLHQRHPSFVIECEGSVIALDDRVAANIFVWVSPERTHFIAPGGRRRLPTGWRRRGSVRGGRWNRPHHGPG
jgi:DtxR family Mn-dependent transcriptional regulator